MGKVNTMNTPTDPIFRDQNEPEERPTDYIANPVRVQLPKYDARAEGRRWTQMDLVALANNILARETECAELRKQVRALTIQVSGLHTKTEVLQESDTRLFTRLEALHASVNGAGTGRYGGKLGRILTAIEKILSEDDDEYDEYRD